MYRLLILTSLGTALGCTNPPPEVSYGEIATFTDDGKELPADPQMVRLARTEPMAFLEACIARCNREVKGYRCTLIKQERIGGELLKPEELRVAFQESPFSVILRINEARAKPNAAARQGSERRQDRRPSGGTRRVVGIVGTAGGRA